MAMDTRVLAAVGVSLAAVAGGLLWTTWGPSHGPLVGVYLAEVKVQPRDDEDRKWDDLFGDTGPDLYYKVKWSGQTVFTSATHGDSLNTVWGLEEPGPAGLLRELFGDPKHPRLDGDATIQVSVWDADAPGQFEALDTLVGEWTVSADHVADGKGHFLNPAKGIREAALAPVWAPLPKG